MFSKRITKHFKSFGIELTEPHAKLDADMVDFAINRRQNKTKQNKKQNKTQS
jgi:carbohydrate-selective porin OprB